MAPETWTLRLIRSEVCLRVFAASLLVGTICVIVAFKFWFFGAWPLEVGERTIRSWSDWLFVVGISFVFLSIVALGLAVALALLNLGERRKGYDRRQDDARED